MNSYIKVNNYQVDARLEVYIFQEDDYYIVYCPALDISAAGRNKAEAKQEFNSLLSEHFRWCIEHGTLQTDLQQHGWTLHTGNYISPKATILLIGNDTFRDVIDNKDYQRAYFPQTATYQLAN